jgi:hypothetical protein
MIETDLQKKSGSNHPMYSVINAKLAKNSMQVPKALVPSSANPITAQLSFGSLGIVNLVRDLNMSFENPANLKISIASLVSLAELLHSSRNVSQALKINAVESLSKYYTSDNIACRQKASDCIRLISSHAAGRELLLKTKIHFDNLVLLVKDKDDFVRSCVHETFVNLTMMPTGNIIILNFRCTACV